MPYPPTHLLFFGFSVLIAGVISMAALSFEGRVKIRDKMFLVVLLIAGSIATLFPDVPAVWNLILHGNLRHNMVGPIPSHSLLFGCFTVVLAGILGYIVYRDSRKTASLGLIAGIAFFFHLVLDDLEGGNVQYLYPLTEAPLSIFGSQVLASLIQTFKSLLF